jgi:transcriptional regulator with PAS, ATPase and Fis domain
MLETIKNKLWKILEDKKVSLAMIYNRQGEIIWHRGRRINGKNIEEGSGFSKSFLQKTFLETNLIKGKNLVVVNNAKNLSDSAQVLNIKSVIVQPISSDFYLYIDSGIKDFFSKSDFEVFRVLGSLLGEMINQIQRAQKDIGGLAGDSEIIQELRNLVIKYAIEEEPVLLLGETGVGKSHIAELIHHYSGRSGKFFTINTPSIPENLFESEIFGHRKGAFTDATTDKPGFVAEAEGGTLFFDEIADVPTQFQAKLLRFIDTKNYIPLGDTQEKTANVRIITATNHDLQDDITKKNFRKDLYFRLQVLEMTIPPLRERKNDIYALVNEKRKHLKGKTIGNGFWDTLLNYDWPGNVRELITVLIRAGIHCADPINGKELQTIIAQNKSLSATILPEKVLPSKPVIPANTDSKKSTAPSAEAPANSNSIDLSFDHTPKEFLDQFDAGKNFWDTLWFVFLKRDINRKFVKQTLKLAYEKNNLNFKKMTLYMNIHDDDYHKFMSLMHKYKIDPRK